MSFLLWLYQGTACTFFLEGVALLSLAAWSRYRLASLLVYLPPFLGPWLLARMGLPSCLYRCGDTCQHIPQAGQDPVGGLRKKHGALPPEPSPKEI